MRQAHSPLARRSPLSRSPSTESQAAWAFASRRQVEDLETRLCQQIQGVQLRSESSREALRSWIDAKMASTGTMAAKCELKLAELAGRVTAMSDEVQAQVRRSDSLDMKFSEFRRELQEDLWQKTTAIESIVQDVSAKGRVDMSTMDETIKRHTVQIRALEGPVADVLEKCKVVQEELEELTDRVEANALYQSEQTKCQIPELDRAKVESVAVSSQMAAVTAEVSTSLAGFRSRLAEDAKALEWLQEQVCNDVTRLGEHEQLLKVLRTGLQQQQERARKEWLDAAEQMRGELLEGMDKRARLSADGLRGDVAALAARLDRQCYEQEALRQQVLQSGLSAPAGRVSCEEADSWQVCSPGETSAVGLQWNMMMPVIGDHERGDSPQEGNHLRSPSGRARETSREVFVNLQRKLEARLDAAAQQWSAQLQFQADHQERMSRTLASFKARLDLLVASSRSSSLPIPANDGAEERVTSSPMDDVSSRLDEHQAVLDELMSRSADMQALITPLAETLRQRLDALDLGALFTKHPSASVTESQRVAALEGIVEAKLREPQEELEKLRQLVLDDMRAREDGMSKHIASLDPRVAQVELSMEELKQELSEVGVTLKDLLTKSSEADDVIASRDNSRRSSYDSKSAAKCTGKASAKTVKKPHQWFEKVEADLTQLGVMEARLPSAHEHEIEEFANKLQEVAEAVAMLASHRPSLTEGWDSQAESSEPELHVQERRQAEEKLHDERFARLKAKVRRFAMILEQARERAARPPSIRIMDEFANPISEDLAEIQRCLQDASLREDLLENSIMSRSPPTSITTVAESPEGISQKADGSEPCASPTGTLLAGRCS